MLTSLIFVLAQFGRRGFTLTGLGDSVAGEQRVIDAEALYLFWKTAQHRWQQK